MIIVMNRSGYLHQVRIIEEFIKMGDYMLQTEANLTIYKQIW